jgi:hypothetical protein
MSFSKAWFAGGPGNVGGEGTGDSSCFWQENKKMTKIMTGKVLM